MSQSDRLNLGVFFKARYGKKAVFVALVTAEKTNSIVADATGIILNRVRAINYTAKFS